MNKYLLLFFTILFSFTVDAQDGCVEISPLIVSTSNSDILEAHPTTGEIYRYFDLCAGETLSLQAAPDLSENTSFQWLLDGVIESNNDEFEETFDDFGGHILTLTTTEEGCDAYSEQVRIRVGTEPVINLLADPSTVCPGIVSSIGSDVNSDLNFSAEIETGGWESFPCEDEFAEPTDLPDDNGSTFYETEIELSCFGESQVLENVNDIISVDINLQHSYTGDLDIFLTSPNGVQVVLFEQHGGSTWFGQATDGDAANDLNIDGVGYDYGWSMNPEYNGTMANAMDANHEITVDNLYNGGFNNTGTSLISSTYFPIGNFNDFLGTPLNGTWTITVVDNLFSDNGWIYSWGITINQNIIPSSWSFDNYIVDESFVISNDNIVSYTNSSINIQPQPGTHNYTYEVVDNFGCTFYDEIEITATSYINPNPIIAQEECGGLDGQIDLNISGGTPGYSVSWDSELTGETIIDLSAGTYFYTITDGLGCEISGNETIQNIETGLTFDTEIFDDHCDQAIGEIIITPTNGAYPYYYTWSHSNTNQDSTANNLIEGTYEIFILDNDGCEGNLLINIDNIDGPTAFFNQNFDTVTYVDGIVDFLNFSSAAAQTELISNQWSFGNGQFSNLESPSHNFNQIGNYFVQLTVTDNFDCTDSYIREVVAVEDYFIWTPSAFTPNGDGKNDLYIPKFHNIIEESFEFFIYDKWGKLVYETTDINSGWDGIRLDNGKIADNSSYSFIAKFITYRNQLQKKTGSFLLLK
tara:strand:- start:927 stop:3185 length:2259 start_codon:yes stop_codon:yes gene_type:complete